MTASVLLDVTRSASRRFLGQTPSGIDRVCDAYAAHFAGSALAVVQFRGRPVVLNSKLSAVLFGAFDEPPGKFRRTVTGLACRLPLNVADAGEVANAAYLNVGHTDFDLGSHWRWVREHQLRAVAFIHDLIPLTHPEVTTKHKTARHRGRVDLALAGAVGIVVNSQATADELRRYVTLSGSRQPPVLTAPIAGAGLQIPFGPDTVGPAAFVSIGTIETRKNHLLLLEVWSRLAERMGDETPKLILAGSWGLGGSAVREKFADHPVLRKYVEIRTGLKDVEFAQIIFKARAVLLPTLAEGFGLPMAEALRLGVPVIASDLAAFREVGQGVPTLLDPQDVAAWQNAVLSFSRSGGERERQLIALHDYVAAEWSDHFSAIEAWLPKLPAAARSPGGTCATGHFGIYNGTQRKNRRGLEA